MTELTQPPPASIETPPPPRKRRRGLRAAQSPSFADLVYAHFTWWQALHTHAANGGSSAYRDLLERFQRRHGEIVRSYWCSHVESAVALTEKHRGAPWPRREVEFYRETDWATRDHPDIAGELHRCDDLAVRAKTVLKGVRQRICLQLVIASAAHLLSLVDARASHDDEARTAAALEQERARLDKVEAYYCQAANGQAQIVYFMGMAAVAATLGLVCALWLAHDWARPIAALIAGALGAVVSVIQRINAGHFELEYDVGRPYAFFLGALRPLIGGAFALAISFTFMSGILDLPLASHDPEHERLALLVISFLAGFSERWAQDTLATALPVRERPQEAPPAGT